MISMPAPQASVPPAPAPVDARRRPSRPSCPLPGPQSNAVDAPRPRSRCRRRSPAVTPDRIRPTCRPASSRQPNCRPLSKRPPPPPTPTCRCTTRCRTRPIRICRRPGLDAEEAGDLARGEGGEARRHQPRAARPRRFPATRPASGSSGSKSADHRRRIARSPPSPRWWSSWSSRSAAAPLARLRLSPRQRPPARCHRLDAAGPRVHRRVAEGHHAAAPRSGGRRPPRPRRGRRRPDQDPRGQRRRRQENRAAGRADQGRIAPPSAPRAAASAAAAPRRPRRASRSSRRRKTSRSSRNGRLLGSSASGRVALDPGSHLIEIRNDSLGFQATRTVQVLPGKTVRVSIALPEGNLSINATPWAEVTVDGRGLGETPIANVTLRAAITRARLPASPARRLKQTVVVKAGETGRVTVNMLR